MTRAARRQTTALLPLLALAAFAAACDGDPSAPAAPVPAQLTPAPAAVAQEAPAGAVAEHPPAVTVTDAAGAPIAGVEVLFDVTLGGGTVERARDTTDAAGVASAGAWTLGEAPGTNRVVASVANLVATFTAEGLDPCVPSPVSFPGQASGVVDDGTCIVDGFRRSYHEFVLTQETDVVLEGYGEPGEGWCICLEDEDGRFIAGSQGPMYHRLVPGVYRVVVNTRSLTSFGAYNFSLYTGVPENRCQHVHLTFGATVSGTITPDDCQWFPRPGGMGDGRTYHTYSLHMSAGETVELELDATQPMQIEASAGLDVTGQSETGTSVRFSYTAERRTYHDFIVIGHGGSYTLRIR
jgi:hypothetical protein